MVAIGFVVKHEDGSYTGELKTLTIATPIEIRRNLKKDNPRSPDYRVFAANNVEIGSGSVKIGQSSGAEYLALLLSIPEFGPKRLTANLGRIADQGDENLFAIIWNPES